MERKQKKTFDPIEIREDFPILNQTIHRERPLVYFDNGASTQHPTQVLEAMDDCYVRTYANVHRGIHWLSEQSSAQYEQARTSVRRFINASHGNEVIFTSGTTESINLIARSWGDANLTSGDEILLTMLEHHSNIVPWQQLAKRTGTLVKFIKLTEAGELDLDHMRSLLSPRTKIVAFASVSNVLGSRAPVAEMTAMAKEVGALVVVDAAQSVPHDKTDVQSWGADFIAFSGHKMLGPSGVGVLWGRQSILEEMQPFMGGGSMIDQVTTDGFTWGELPARFEAGTPPIVEAIGLGKAIEYLENIDVAQIEEHEQVLVRRAYELIMEVDGAKILGPAGDCRAGLVSFVIEGVSSQDISILLDQLGIAIRAGHHCAMPLHKQLEIKASCRASFYLYNTLDEVEAMGAALKKVVQRLR